MFQKSHLERVLKINGVSPTAPDEEIRELFLSAKYNDNEVESALTVLRQNIVSKETSLESAHKIFRGDARLNAQEISQLLGIDVVIAEPVRRSRSEQPSAGMTTAIVLFVTVTIICAAISSLYLFEIG